MQEKSAIFYWMERTFTEISDEDQEKTNLSPVFDHCCNWICRDGSEEFFIIFPKQVEKSS